MNDTGCTALLSYALQQIRLETPLADGDEFDRWRVDEALLDDLLLPNVIA